MYTENEIGENVDCGNELLINGIRKHCQAPLKESLIMPYRPISTWIEEKIKLYGSQQFKAM
jgi:hypothetical protein